jgi:D-3-phosphoglycerate dehydrogenase
MAAAKGLLGNIVEGAVSYVNSMALADERGITVDEGRSSEESPYAGLLRLTLETDRGETTVAGTFLGPNRARLVEVDGMSIESRPDGHMLFLRNRDVPGVVGKIGTILGKAGVNIAGLQLGRSRGGDTAMSIIGIDTAVPRAAIDEIERMDEIVLVRTVSV